VIIINGHVKWIHNRKKFLVCGLGFVFGGFWFVGLFFGGVVEWFHGVM
jgi:hypothetical protein